MTSLEWKRCIVEMVHVHQRIHELDTERLWEHHLPELAATQDQLDQVEAHLGEPLDAHYRQFLDLAGGWRVVSPDLV